MHSLFWMIHVFVTSISPINCFVHFHNYFCMSLFRKHGLALVLNFFCIAIPSPYFRLFWIRLLNRGGMSSFGPSPMSSRHGSQESLRHLSQMGSMSMLQTPTSNSRDAQKKKGIKSSLGRFFSKKEKVNNNYVVLKTWTCISEFRYR